MFSWSSLQRPIIALAPMADMTDMPFCLMSKKFGVDVIFREMISAEAIIRGNEKTWKMANFDEQERPIIQQIFGNDPAKMAEAAHMIEERLHPDGIDINMGCPVHKITSNFDGASLIRDPDRAVEIVKAIKDAVTIPVSVKTRLGWNNKSDILAFLRKLKCSGVDLITVHGRTKEQGYAGKADWEAVGVARRIVPEIPFLVNGDIVDAKTARQALDVTGADGVMIGRGALGNPWIFSELREILHTTDEKIINYTPSFDERKAIILEHAQLHIKHYGDRGLIKLRKHLLWYFKNNPEWKELRAKLVRVTMMEELEEILSVPR